MNLSDITKEHIESIEVHCPLNPETVIKLPMDQVQCRTRTSNEKFVSAQLGFNCSACDKFHLSDLIPEGFLVISGAARPGEWLPIETAPKTRTAILIYVPDNKCIYVVTWKDWGRDQGWFLFGGGTQDRDENLQRATCWMPLPLPPVINNS